MSTPTSARRPASAPWPPSAARAAGSRLVAKVLTEAVLFAASFVVQRRFVSPRLRRQPVPVL